MSTAFASAALGLVEGIELGHALIARVADDVGARALIIKGQVHEMHGLRRPRTSVDVDVLVEPGRHSDVVAALSALGWREPPKPATPQPFGAHSVTLGHPEWPCELDVHDRFPGFLADPADVFDAIWVERTSIPAAGRVIAASGLHGSVLIMALHALRTPSDPRNVRELEDLVSRLAARPLEPRTLSALAGATGCLTTARPFLLALGVDEPETDVDACAVIQWQLRRSAGATRNLGWLVAMRRTPPWRWPALAVAVLMSSEAYLRRCYPQAPPGRRGLWLARWWRLRLALRDVRHVPRSIRLARQIR